MNKKFSQALTLIPEDHQRLRTLCGPCNEYLNFIAERLDVTIKNRGHRFTISGDQPTVEQTVALLTQLYADSANRDYFSAEEIHLSLHTFAQKPSSTSGKGEVSKAVHKRRGTPHSKSSSVKARGHHQQNYMEKIRAHSLNFGIGPAGTGKTFLAVACAVEALEQEKVHRLVLVRPAVEAGEKLGFLPGDMAQKVDPYLRPLYDALFELMGVDRVNKLLSQNIIEVVPLAYMRGRTLNHAFIILDESQNTSVEQMKMFLTRIGFDSTAVVNGDITQIDLPRHQRSGLVDAIDVLEGSEGISFSFFDHTDVVRHPIVQTVLKAYEQHEKRLPSSDD
ncbi:MAG: PhoH family protein [Gammaproteobacteria bacterium]|nr:PhoH family protein [Gammaproteobacteria bacterium]